MKKSNGIYKKISDTCPEEKLEEKQNPEKDSQIEGGSEGKVKCEDHQDKYEPKLNVEAIIFPNKEDI
jgi:hypothetical protein